MEEKPLQELSVRNPTWKLTNQGFGILKDNLKRVTLLWIRGDYNADFKTDEGDYNADFKTDEGDLITEEELKPYFNPPEFNYSTKLGGIIEDMEREFEILFKQKEMEILLPKGIE